MDTTTVLVCSLDGLDNLTVTMGSDKQMDSKSTAKLLKTRVCQHLKLSTLEEVELYSRTPSSSSRQPLAACKLRAKEFAEQNATVEVDVVAPLRSSRAALDKLTQQVGQLLGRLDAQDSQIRELQAAHSAQLATNSAQLATNSAQLATDSAQLATNSAQLQAAIRELRGRVDVLASLSAAHGLVLLRHVVNLAHQKLEQRFDSDEDSRPQDMQFSVWLAALQARHPQYFEQHHLDAPALQLLHKGQGTPLHAGNLAAPQAHVDAALADAAREQPAWNTLWAFVTSPER